MDLLIKPPITEIIDISNVQYQETFPTLRNFIDIEYTLPFNIPLQIHEKREFEFTFRSKFTGGSFKPSSFIRIDKIITMYKLH